MDANPTRASAITASLQAQGNLMTKLGITLLRSTLAAIIALSLWTAAHAKATAVEYLLVPSDAMGRDIPVAFMANGPHAVYLLDAFNAGDTISNWVTAGNAEQDGSKQWETFLSNELPNWLAANTRAWHPAATRSLAPRRAGQPHWS
jgi:S-formylglutathione hydrolase FrmB